jgi:SAM-dependent methyltransferase
VTRDAIAGYTDKVSAYARYRWEYAPDAVDAFALRCGLSHEWVVADIGSGTGMVARHLVNRVRTLYAVEPNPAMRQVATASLGAHASYREVGASFDNTTLADASVDLIAVGRALHWFPAESTRNEFRRILRPGGWLAVLSVPVTDRRLLAAIRTVEREEYGWDLSRARFTPETVSSSFYFGQDPVQTVTHPGLVRETFDMLLGRVSSQLATPEPGHPLRPTFERALRDVFDRYAIDGVLTVPIATEIEFGQPTLRE